MTQASDANETHEIAELLFALVGQTAVQGERCASECGVSIVQASVLLSIQDDMSMRELATRQGGHASNATGIADRLAARGLIERHDDPADRRVKRISLTSEGSRRPGQAHRLYGGGTLAVRPVIGPGARPAARPAAQSARPGADRHARGQAPGDADPRVRRSTVNPRRYGPGSGRGASASRGRSRPGRPYTKAAAAASSAPPTAGFPAPSRTKPATNKAATSNPCTRRSISTLSADRTRSMSRVRPGSAARACSSTTSADGFT